MTDRRQHADGPGPRFGQGDSPRPEPTAEQRRRVHEQPAGLLPAVQSMLYVLVAALFLITFTVQPIRIPSASMEPTLLVGDFLLLDKQATAGPDAVVMPPAGIARGDIVVFHDPGGDLAVHLIKRVIGIPGDRLHLRDGLVYLNGQPLRESYAVRRPAAFDGFRDDFPNLHTMDPSVSPAWWVRLRGLVQDGEVTVPDGMYFVLGDNRNNSEDSRYWGFVPAAAIVGKPKVIYFSRRTPADDELGDTGPRRQVEDAAGVRGRTDFARWERMFRVVR